MLFVKEKKETMQGKDMLKEIGEAWSKLAQS